MRLIFKLGTSQPHGLNSDRFIRGARGFLNGAKKMKKKKNTTPTYDLFYCRRAKPETTRIFFEFLVLFEINFFLFFP